MKKEDVLELVDLAKLTSLLEGLKGHEVIVRKKPAIDWKKVACIIAAIAAVCGAAYAVYRFIIRDRDEDFTDDFDDWDDDGDFFDDDVDDLEEE